MKLIIAYLHPEQLPAVKESLADAGIQRFTVMTVLGTVPKAEQVTYRGVEHEISMVNRLRIEIATKASDVDTAMTAIAEGAKQSGGHGLVLSTGLDDVQLIWDGKQGEAAL
jgi:nitrogen regulatory protein P-II 2